MEATNKKRIIVVGGGLAGLCAAIEAQKYGSEVILIEKESRIGGNSKKASSGINGVNTATQRSLQIADSPQQFLQDTIKSGNLTNHELAEVLVAKSNEAIEFLSSFGINLEEITKCGGHSQPRTHRAKPLPRGPQRNIGFTIMNTLESFVTSYPPGRLRIITSARVTKLLTKDGAVIGVSYKDRKYGKEYDIFGDAVILTSGGYAADREGLLKEYAPSVAQLPTTNGDFAVGDGVKLAADIGAELVDMSQVQVHPTGFVDPSAPLNPTKILAAEALRGCGGILVNSAGQRFVNELGLRNKVTEEIFRCCSKLNFNGRSDGVVVAYLILNEDAVRQFQDGAFQFYLGRGLVKVCENAEEAAKVIGADATTFKKTLLSYNEAKQRGRDEFGKETFPVGFSTSEKLYVMMVTPCIHYTMGGLKISPKAEVLRQGVPIRGLYAAGEVTGGVHGNNRLAGNSLLECVVFGRIAAESAVSSISTSSPLQNVMNELRNILGERLIVTPKIRYDHGKDASYHPPVLPDAVAFPLSTEEVSSILKICNKYKFPVIPYGVGSSLEGHAIPIKGGLSVDTSKMDKILHVYEEDMQVVVQPGIRRIALNAQLKSKKVFFPIDPGANATLGGMVSTRCSGTTAVGYGTMSDNVKALTVVLPNGEVIKTSTRAKKSSTGYDLTHLFIGAEGTLGIVTEITLKMYKLPESIGAAVIPFKSVRDAANTVIAVVRSNCTVHRIELLNVRAIEAVNKKFNINHTVTPTLFVEIHGMEKLDTMHRLDVIKEIALKNGALDFKGTEDEKEREELWEARHNCYWASASLRPNTKLFVTDVCVPISRLADCIAETEADFEKSFLIAPLVGHVGDGNFHLMVPVDPSNSKDMEEINKMNDRLVRRAIAMGGTASGEHGIGYGKAKWLELEHGENAVKLMRTLKSAIDPNNIMNPGKLFPQSKL